VAVALFVVTSIWGRPLRAKVKVGAAPLTGAWDLRLSPLVIPAAAFAMAAVLVGPLVARRLAWRSLLIVTAAATGGWAVLLAVTNGRLGLTDPIVGRFEYLPFVSHVHHVGRFVDQFSEHLRDYPIHVKGHPPGMVLVLAGLDAIGLGGAGWAAAVMIAGYAVGVVSLLVTVRSLAGERPARLAAPFVVLAPAAVYAATSADAFFAGVALLGLALFTLAGERRGVAGHGLAIAAGVVLGWALFLSYGFVLLAVPVVGVAVVRRRWRPLLLAGVGVGLVVAGFLGAGFWWLDGLRATHVEYLRGVGGRRPYGYFVFANLAAFAVVIGPATAAAIARMDRSGGRGRWLVMPALGLATVVLADVSGLSKAEVERIWLFLVPPVVAATAFLGDPDADRVPRRWLALHVATGLALQVSLDAPW